MPNLSARLNLKKPVLTDPFDTDVLAGNWQIIDDFPGTWIGNSAPTWGVAHTGMLWSQPSTGLVWKWNGASFDRLNALGSIGSAARTSPFVETTGAFQTVVQKTGAVVPDGGRRIMVVVSWSDITGDDVGLRVLRGATVIQDWSWWTGGGGSMTILDAPAAGTYTYAFQVKTKATSSTIGAAATYPIQLEIIEI